jgi:DNA repair exonuclease SbcCD nuclease subunit
MTRFIYMADTHCGADPMGYCMQAGYPQRLPELLAALESWMAASPVDFILHGGDMVDAGTDENIGRAAALFRLSVPVYLCLGNHDVTEESSLARWASLAGSLLPGGTPTYTLGAADCVIHVAPNQWEPGEPYIWRQQQQAHLLDDQLDHLDQTMRQRPQDPHVLLTHSPVHGLPPQQTGHTDAYHAPPDAFAEQIHGLVDSHAAIRCVLGAHNHMNMHLERGPVHYVTASSWSEAPFEFKLFEADAGGISMSTRWLGDSVGFPWEYDFNRTFVQGREPDRGFG